MSEKFIIEKYIIEMSFMRNDFSLSSYLFSFIIHKLYRCHSDNLESLNNQAEQQGHLNNFCDDFRGHIIICNHKTKDDRGLGGLHCYGVRV